MVDEIPIQMQISVEPFEKWALHFLGPISPTYKKKRYILVCTDHITKLVEANALYSTLEKAVVDFLFEDILNQFGLPREIVTNQGTQFMSKIVKAINNNIRSIIRSLSPTTPNKTDRWNLQTKS